ncbi:MAG: V-type ATP synthase subunit K, partial [Candidatus Aenigmarchaeota archaeon]|nr:V-type ATP synthase subunit K [Candidatus Aenigmarchaeota archaeon]
TFFSGNVLGAVGAAIAIAIAGVSSARGLEIAGNTAAGATGEKEENFSSALILQALPQTQVIYAFIIG